MKLIISTCNVSIYRPEPIICSPIQGQSGVGHSPRIVVVSFRTTSAAQWPRTTLQSYLQGIQDIGVLGTHRFLQQAPAASVTVVNTAQELVDAVAGGSTHIEIRSHLDLRTVEPIHTSYLLFSPFSVAEVVIWVCVESLV